MHRFRASLALFLLAPVCAQAQAQATPSPDQAELIKTLLVRIEQLEKRAADVDRLEQRVGELEAARGLVASQPSAPPAAAQAPSEPSALAAAQEHAGPHAGGNQTEHRFPSLQLRGFSDVDFSATDEPNSKSGFTLGQFILHVTSPLSQKITYFAETSFTAQPTGYNLDVERNLIRYDLNDFFKISFGRFHTPINYWNTAFHHGLWLQTTIARPEMIRFGGRFQPVHFLGLLAEGSIPSGPLGLGYAVGLGNGRAGTISRAGDSGDVNNNRAWVANLFARPTPWNALQVGGALYGDEISPSPALPGNPNFRELIATAHVVWTRETPEFLAEFAHVRHRNILTSAEYNSQAFYVQAGYRLPGAAKRLKPYYRFEWSNINPSDPLFNVADLTVAVRDLTGSTLGVRYDISSFAAFKSEYRHVRRTASVPKVNGFFAQTSFTF